MQDRCGFVQDSGSNLFFNFLRVDINNDLRGNTFKLGINNIFEFFRSSAIACESMPTDNAQNTKQSGKKTKIPRGKIGEILYHCLLGFIVVSPLYKVPFPITIISIWAWVYFL